MKLNWGQSIVLFFVIFVSLGIGFIIFSLRQNNDLVTENYYEKGADYTHQMEINSRSAVYNDSIQLMNKESKLVARFSKSIDQMTDSMHINFFRPSDKRFDYEVASLLNSDSISIDKSKLVKGRYKVEFKWQQGHLRYLVVKEFFIE